MVIDTPASEKARLLDATVLFNDGLSVQKARIVGVGNTDDDTDRVYLHIASLEKFRPQKNGNVPVQWCGWYDLTELKFL